MGSRTNRDGIKSLQEVFPDFPVTAVDLDDLQLGLNSSDTCLHLKSFCSMAGDRTILVGGAAGIRFHKLLTSLGKVASTECNVNTSNNTSTNNYEVVLLPDAAAANCLYINKTIVRRTNAEFPASGRIFESVLGHVPQIQVEGSELAKVDGALTCCSLLLLD